MLLSIMAINLAATAGRAARRGGAPDRRSCLWMALLLRGGVRRPDWRLVGAASGGSVLLLALVSAASLMPVGALPVASWRTVLGLGLLSAVFDNIPLTTLALDQGGYDWGFWPTRSGSAGR